MKINDTKEVAPASAVTSARAVQSAEKPNPSEKVSVEMAREVQAAIAAARSSSGPTRSARLQEIASAVKKGQYHPNAQQIAEEILQAAELDAKIRAIFGH